jgi:hypothetical protein
VGMLRPAYPEVLHPEWLPPVALFRQGPVEAARRVLAGVESAGLPVVAVVGPPGSGTSTVGRLAARRWADDERRTAGGRPLVVGLRVRPHRTAQSVATELLQALDSSFSGRGYHPSEIMAGFLRRLRRAERSTTVLLDDLAPGGPDLSYLFHALIEPHRFLPEGDESVPSIRLVAVGSPEARSTWVALDRLTMGRFTRVPLDEYAPEQRVRILTDRLARALGHEVPSEWGSRIVRRALLRARGVTGPMEQLRRELLGRRTTVLTPGPGADATPVIEPPLLAALHRVGAQRRATIAEIRQWEAEFARADGSRPLPATTFWRRIVRLESVGLVHREVRAGGAGGTRSLVEIVGPLNGPGTAPTSPGTPRADGVSLGASSWGWPGA